MDYFLQLFGEIPLSTAIVFIAATSFIVLMCVKTYKFIVRAHDEIQGKETALQSLKDDIKEIKEKQNSQELFMKQVVTKEELQEVQEKEETLEKLLNEIRQIQKEIVSKQDKYEAQSRSHNLNKLRDRLLQSYRYYTSEDRNPLKAWSEMEQDAFNKLFKDYEELGGNGFMHSTVEPEMALLEVVDMNNQARLAELMKSRKG